jgi:hypothetical protein
MTHLDEVFEHNVKNAILNTYVAMMQYKFKIFQEEKDEEKKNKLEVDVYEIVHTLEEMILATKDK